MALFAQSWRPEGDFAVDAAACAAPRKGAAKTKAKRPKRERDGESERAPVSARDLDAAEEEVQEEEQEQRHQKKKRKRKRKGKGKEEGGVCGGVDALADAVMRRGRDSEGELSIRSALMELCDELGEKALAEITPKLLRRKLEKRLDKPEGALDAWKQGIIEWYDFGEQIKEALRTFLEELDDNAAPTKTIQRELEHQLDLDEGELDSWKAEIDRWTIKFRRRLAAVGGDALADAVLRALRGEPLSAVGVRSASGGSDASTRGSGSGGGTTYSTAEEGKQAAARAGGLVQWPYLSLYRPSVEGVGKGRGGGEEERHTQEEEEDGCVVKFKSAPPVETAEEEEEDASFEEQMSRMYVMWMRESEDKAARGILRLLSRQRAPQERATGVE